MISTQKALIELKATTGERNEYSALQTSWADWSRQHLDAQIERGTRRVITDRQHLTPETYGLVKDKAREEVLRDQVEVTTRKCANCPVCMNTRRTHAASIDRFSLSARGPATGAAGQM